MPEQRTLAAAAPAHDHERLAAKDAKGDIVDDRAVTKHSDKVDNFDDGVAVRVHAAKKKIPVSTAFITSMASRAWTTEEVVDCPTPSAPPSTRRPALQAIVMISHAKTPLLIIPEYKSHVSELCNARRM